MYEIVRELVIKWAVPAICAAIFAHSARKFSRATSVISAIRDGVQCLLRNEILRNHDECVDKGFCPLHIKEALVRTYSAYHMLGGNDIATQKYQETMRLPDYPAEVDK